MLTIGGGLSGVAYVLMRRIGRLPTERRTVDVPRDRVRPGLLLGLTAGLGCCWFSPGCRYRRRRATGRPDRALPRESAVRAQLAASSDHGRC